VPAIGLPGAASWNEDWARHLDDISVVYVVIEPDQGGAAIRKWLDSSSLRGKTKLVAFDPYKDASEAYLATADEFGTYVERVLRAAVPWTDASQVERRQRAAAMFGHAEELLNAPDLLHRLSAAITACGFAGNTSPAMLAYLAVTSRFLESPINLVLVAPSAAGKNRAVDAALELIPPEAVHLVGASSPRALVYTEDDFQHRTIVVNEADSLPEDGPAASAIRALAHDNQMVYEVVEKNSGGRFETRKIVKPGPTGLITTSTRSLRTQLGTRHLEVSLPDDADQTRNVMRAQARRVGGKREKRLDTEPFLAVQQWLADAGESRVVIPFAETLAELVPAGAVRMRRDFRQLLTLIATIALLYQLQRKRTEDGAIVATIADYAAAVRFVSPVFDTIVAEGVTPVVRATVDAIQPGEEVSQAELAARLGLSKATVSYRVKGAIRGGWLVDHETRRGHAAKLGLGAPLPDQIRALPDPERLRELFECSSTFGMADVPSPPTFVRPTDDESDGSRSIHDENCRPATPEPELPFGGDV